MVKRVEHLFLLVASPFRLLVACLGMGHNPLLFSVS